ncbi:MAG: hypothetical protein WAX89_01790 [Alphaproteobacteria bacterium]
MSDYITSGPAFDEAVRLAKELLEAANVLLAHGHERDTCHYADLRHTAAQEALEGHAEAHHIEFEYITVSLYVGACIDEAKRQMAQKDNEAGLG